MPIQKNRLIMVCMLCTLLSLTFNSSAQEAEPKYSATTLSDHQVPVEDLELLLKPLTRAELVAEAEAWLELLKDKTAQISAAEIQMRQESRQTEEQVDEAEAEARTEAREQLLIGISKLREEQKTIVDRFNAVLAALKAKGGDIVEYEQYVAAASGLGLAVQDVRDVSAFRIIVWGWLKSPEGGLLWLKSILLFVITLIVFYFLAGAAGKLIHGTVSKSKRFSDLLKEFFAGTTRKAVRLIGIIVALSVLGIDITPFVAGLGVAGFVLGFALQGTLSNFASGLMILVYRPYDVGQVIEAAGVKGKVDSMNLVSTTVKTFDNQIVIVPNGEIWGGVITNVTGSSTRRVDMLFGISYTDDISKAASILEDILSKHDLVLNDPEPVVRLHQLGDSSVDFVCRPWVKTDDYWTVYWDVTRAVKERFDAEDVSIPFPQRDVHLYKAAAES
ncbi:MAG: mechanosensitive ion channel family protein [Planctomycetota bacterium]